MKKLEPLSDLVLIKRGEADEKTAGGIYIPDATREKPMTGTVIAVGPGKLSSDGTRTCIQVKVNDTVMFTKYAGTACHVDGDECIIMKEEEIIAKVKE